MKRIFCALVLLIFVSVLLSDEGVVLQWIVSGLTGLFGRNFYYISMPALAYTIYVLLFSRNQRVRGRCFSIASFVFLFGCASHLLAAPELEATGFALVPELWKSGILGTSGGLICGLLTELLVMAFGRFFVLSMIIILCVLCLMIGAKLDLVGWTKALCFFCADKFRQWRENRHVDDEDDFDEPEEEEIPGVWNRLWDNVAQKRAEKQARKALEPAEPTTPTERTRQMIQQIAPELESRFNEEPVDVLPDDPEVFAEVAAEPGTAPAPVAVKEKVTAQEAAEQAAQVEQEIAAYDKRCAEATEYNAEDYAKYDKLKEHYDHLMHEWEKASYELEITEQNNI